MRGPLAIVLLLTAHTASAQPAARSYSAGEAGTVLGREVVDAAGEDVGRLVDILVDKDGRPLAGLIDVGGFLGVGARRAAVAWRLLRFVNTDGAIRVVMDLTYDAAAAAPEFLGPDNTLIVIDPPPP